MRLLMTLSCTRRNNRREFAEASSLFKDTIFIVAFTFLISEFNC